MRTYGQFHELFGVGKLPEIKRHHDSQGHAEQGNRAHYMLGKKNVLKGNAGEKDKKELAKGYDGLAKKAKDAYKK